MPKPSKDQLKKAIANGHAALEALDIEVDDGEIEIEPAMDGRRLAFDRRMETIDGHLVVKGCHITKANVCPYMGSEIPNAEQLGLDPHKIYNLYRDAAEIQAAADTYNRIPLLMQHVAVSANNPQQFLTVGTISHAKFTYPYLDADLTLWTADGIEAVESGRQRELSCGYRYVAEMTPGHSPDGVPYDGRMTQIVANHIALVEAGRAGPDVMVADSALLKDKIVNRNTEIVIDQGPNIVMDAPRKWPSYHVSELKKWIAEGRPNAAAIQEEIDARESGASQHKVTPQILGGKAQAKIGRM